jgi:hypothetical protein
MSMAALPLPRCTRGSGSLFFITVAARQLPKKENLRNS